MAEAPRKSVRPRFEPGRWSFFPCRHSSEQCFQNHYRALATPANTELPKYPSCVCSLLVKEGTVHLFEHVYHTLKYLQVAAGERYLFQEFKNMVHLIDSLDQHSHLH